MIIAFWLTLLQPGIASVNGQSFEELLTRAVTRFDTAMSRSSIGAGTAELDEIAVKYPDKWASHFYSAYAHLKGSFAGTDKGRRDQLIDGAEAALNKADRLSPGNQEIFILRAWSAKARLAVDPQDRWKKCNALYDDAIAKAKRINPENPRIYFLDGQGYFYKPRIWGGGKDKARACFLKAKQLFAREDKGDILRPSWGEKANEEFLAKCND
jgi:hypothetical protein